MRGEARFLSVMTNEEGNLINGLFDRLDQAVPRQPDVGAEQVIRSRVAANPYAPYLLTQSTLVLQQAVTAAQGRIAVLERQLAEQASPQGSGSFLSGITNLFAPSQPAPVRPVPPSPQQAPAQASQGGGFLQGALATAAGVAGGALLFQGIEGLLGHHPGPFGGMGGSGSVGGFDGQNQPMEVTNNYYGSPASTGDVDTLSGTDQANIADTMDDDTNGSDLFAQDDTGFSDDGGDV